MKLYQAAHEFALERGIILPDTKFEFGMFDGEIILIDEVLTPDSSRFWPADQYQPGRGQPSFDKQFVRDYLQELCNERVGGFLSLQPHAVVDRGLQNPSGCENVRFLRYFHLTYSY